MYHPAPLHLDEPQRVARMKAEGGPLLCRHCSGRRRRRNLRGPQRGHSLLMLSNTLQQLWEYRVLRRPCQSPSLPQWHNGRRFTRCSGSEESASSTLTLKRMGPSDERKPCGRPYFRRFDPAYSCGLDLWIRQEQSFQRLPFLQTTMTTGSSPRARSPQLSFRPQGGIL